MAEMEICGSVTTIDVTGAAFLAVVRGLLAIPMGLMMTCVLSFLVNSFS